MNKIIRLKLVAVLFIILLIGNISFAEDNEIKLDGRFWNNANEDQKLFYVTGFRDGTNLFASRFSTDTTEDKELNTKVFEIVQVMRDYLVLRLTYGEIVEKIDEFYSDPFNRSIPIFESYNYICVSYLTATNAKFQTDTDSLLKNLRNKYNKH